MLGRTNMKKIYKTILTVAVLLITFVLIVFIEAEIRYRATRKIPVDCSSVKGVKVTASVQPDFLWAGNAWHIDIETDKTVELDIDNKWQAKIPAGQHKIFYSSDATNTNKFSSKPWFKTPSKITIRNPNEVGRAN